MITSGKTSDNDWQRVVISANFAFFWISEKPVTKHPKEDFLHLEEKIEEIVELRAEANL